MAQRCTYCGKTEKQHKGKPCVDIKGGFVRYFTHEQRCAEGEMTDLTKLTAEEILSVWPLEDDEIAEIRLRLERLEKCEAALRTAYRFLGRVSNLPKNTNWAGEKWDTTIPEEMKKEAWTIMQEITDAARAALEE